MTCYFRFDNHFRCCYTDLDCVFGVRSVRWIFFEIAFQEIISDNQSNFMFYPDEIAFELLMN